MIISLALAAAFGGFLAGPVLAVIAERAVGREEPLLAAADRGLALGRDRAAWTWRSAVTRLATAALTGGIVLALGARWVIPAYLWFVGLTVILTITDLARKLIPNRITLPGFIGGVLLLSAGALLDGDPERLVWAAIGAAGYLAFMMVLALIVPGGLGFGDVKLAAILGWFVAAEHLGYAIVAAIGAYVIGGVASALFVILRIKRLKDTVPFGPYMVAAAYVALFAGNAIVDWYLN